MAINRGTRKEMFVHMVETFSMLGILVGAGWGVYQALGANPFDMLMSVIRYGIFGFIGGTALGIVLGALAAIYSTIFG